MSATPEKEVFINVIVACVTKHRFNGMLAAKELAELHAYPLEAAAFAALLALTYVDAAPGVLRLLKMTSERLAEDVAPAVPGWNFSMFDLLADASVASVINAWSRTPEETIAGNPTTQLVRFALDYRAYGVVAVLLGCEQVAAQISLAFFRDVMKAVANELEEINKSQMGDDVLVHIDDDTMERTRHMFEDGGVHTLTEACNLVYRFNERRMHVTRVHDGVVDPHESSRLDVEIALARGRTQNERLVATAHSVDQCLQRITADERDLILKQLTQHKTARDKLAVAADYDPDEDYDDKIPPSEAEVHFATLLRNFEHQSKTFESERHAEGGLTWRYGYDVDTQINAYNATISALRSQLKLAHSLTKLNNQALAELEVNCDEARQNASDNSMTELRNQLLNLEPDEYIQ
jgi:hypothetical protein